ncbi:LysR family transcriptional regulator [Photobacterium sp. DNB22_13_2]
MDTDLTKLDLNLLRLLRTVVETRSTTLAAEKLGISQASVSRGVGKLRELFGEQLFLRKAHSIEPSELAIRLAEATTEMMNPISKVLDSFNNFDPLQFRGKVSFAVNTYLLEVFGERLMHLLASKLPNATFELDYWQSQSLTDMLNGKIDYALQISNFPFPQDVYSHHIKAVESGILARKNHPVLEQGNEWDKIHSLPLVQLYLAGVNYDKSALHELYELKGYKAHVTLKTHSLKAALYTIKTTDAICYSSSYVAELGEDIQVYPLPLLSEDLKRFDIIGGYLQTRRNYPLNQFLHQIIQAFFDAIQQPGEGT